MGGIIEVRQVIGAGTVSVTGNDNVEVEKNDVVQKAFSVPNIPWLADTAGVHFDGVQFLGSLDWDDLSTAQKDAIMNDPTTQVVKKFGSP